MTADKSIGNSSIQRTRKPEKWSDIVSKLNIDMHMPVNYVTAKEIKQISNEEPRLMAKLDTLESLPKIFRDNAEFLLPISRKEYAVVKGNGYHKLEPVTDKLIIYTTQIPFPKSAIGVKSEGVFLEYANSCGLLHKLSGEDNLVKAFSSRRGTPKFTFDVNTSRIEVNRAQIEVDALFESSKQILLFEAKIGIPSSFNIRQIYYPYRTTLYGSKKPIRNFIFYFKPEQRIYLFWEYEFDPYDSFESIRLIQCKQYKIVVSKALSAKGYQNIKPIKSKTKIPQADDVNKIIQFPLRVFDGYDTAKRMVNAFGFVNRQSSYYRHASEILGLVIVDNNRYKLTDKGKEYLKLPAEKKSNFICKLLLEFPIINEIFIQISSDSGKVISKQDIIELLKKKSYLTGSTLGRRAQTILSWFRWIRNNLGIVEVSKEGSIRIARQTKLS